MISLMLLFIGVLIGFVGLIMLIVAAFRTRILWGVAALLLPYAGLLFAVFHWRRARIGFFVYLLGHIVFFGSLFGGATAEIQNRMRQAGMADEEIAKLDAYRLDGSQGETESSVFPTEEEEQLPITQPLSRESSPDIRRPGLDQDNYRQVSVEELDQFKYKVVRLTLDDKVLQGLLTEVQKDQLTLGLRRYGGTLGLKINFNEIQSVEVLEKDRAHTPESQGTI